MYGDILFNHVFPPFFPGHTTDPGSHDNSLEHTCPQAGFWIAEVREQRQNPDRSVKI